VVYRSVITVDGPLAPRLVELARPRPGSLPQFHEDGTARVFSLETLLPTPEGLVAPDPFTVVEEDLAAQVAATEEPTDVLAWRRRYWGTPLDTLASDVEVVSPGRARIVLGTWGFAPVPVLRSVAAAHADARVHAHYVCPGLGHAGVLLIDSARVVLDERSALPAPVWWTDPDFPVG